LIALHGGDDEAGSSPSDNWSIWHPTINTLYLLSTMRAQMSLPFSDGPVRGKLKPETQTCRNSLDSLVRES